MRLEYRQEHDRVCCTGCSLHPQFTGNLTWYTPTEIEGQSDIMFVAGAPGAEEDAYRQVDGTMGRPLIGVSGQIHRACMQAAGILGDYVLANVCKCRPLKNKTPNEEEVNHCLPYLLEEIQRHKPKVVVCLGGTALQALAPELMTAGIRRAQGRYIEKDGVTYLANIHPSFIARMHDPKQKDALTKTYTNVLSTALKLVQDDPTVDWLKDGHYYYVDTLDKLKGVVDSYLTTPAVEGILVLDTETRGGLNRFHNQVSMLQFCNDGMFTALIPFMHPESPWSPDDLEVVKSEIIRLLNTPTDAFQWIVGNYLKFDLAMLKTCIHPDLGTARLPIHGSLLDTMFLAHCVDEQRLKRIPKNKGPMSLATLASDYLHWTKFEESGMKKKRADFDKISLFDEGFRDYCAMDGYVPHRLARQLLNLADKEEGGRERVLNFNVHMHGPLICAFEAIERNGFQVDVPHLRILCGELSPIKKRMKSIKEELISLPEVQKANTWHLRKTKAAGMVGLFGVPWVLDFDKKDCLITLLVDVLELEPLAMSKPKIDARTGREIPQPEINTAFFERYRSDENVAEEENVEVTPTQHIIDIIYEYKGLYKLDRSYTKSVNKRINEEGPNGECADGRMRASFTSCRVTSGRTSSEKVNLQQIPNAKGRLEATNAARRAVKNMYCVPQGRLLVQMDVAQAEIRAAVQLAQDRNYAKVFWNMEKVKKEFLENPTEENKKRVKYECDIHRQTASLMHQIPISEVTPLQRQGAKSLVFGMLFGKHVKTLAKDLDVAVDTAQSLLETFFSQFPEVERWLLNAEKEAQTKGYVTSTMGRRRHLAHEYAEGNAGRGNRQARNCIAGDSLIPTQRGLIPINLINEGDIVQTPFGENRVLAKTNSGVQDTWEVATKVGYSVSATRDHPLLVWTDKCTFKWKEVFELKEGDYIVYKIGAEESYKNKEPDLRKFIFKTACGYETRSKCYDLPATLTPEISEMLGAIISEGCLDTREGVVTYTNKDRCLIVNFCNLWKTAFGEELALPISFRRKDDKVHILRGYSTQIAKFFEWLGVSQNTASYKEVPWVIFRTNLTNLRAFLKGLFEGDGHLNKRGISYYSASEKLISQLQVLLANLGVIGAKRCEKLRDAYRELNGHTIVHNYPSRSVLVQGKDQDKLAVLLNKLDFVIPRTIQSRRGSIPHLKEVYKKRLQARGKTYKGRRAIPTRWSLDSDAIIVDSKCVTHPNLESCTDEVLDNMAFFAPDLANTLDILVKNNLRITEVTSIAKNDLPEEVWDIQVQNSECFIANGLAVHNSPIQAFSSDYNLIAGTRLQHYIEENGKDWKIVNLVHDSIITEISYDEASLREYVETSEKLFIDTSCLKEMFNIEMIVPLAVDYEIGFKYGDCKVFDRSEKSFKDIWTWLEQQVAEGVAWPKQEGHVWQ